MKVKEVREKYIEFFKKSPRDHKEIPAASLVPENDPTTLFTSSGMQPLIPYLMGEAHPMGKRLVDSQPSIRVQDITEVGDNRHTTFFEMLGNWSLGDYFKKEQLAWFWEFLIKELELPKERLYVSCFEGNESVPKDNESAEVWKKLGVSDDHIFFYDVSKNWWSRSGEPVKMPVNEIGGPDSEVFFEFENVIHDKKFGEKCHPNCDCGRFLEIGNSVFIQYIKEKNGSLKELPQKNVDFGGGLERLAAATSNDPDVFKIDVFSEMVSALELQVGKKYEESEKIKRSFRVIADHARASTMLICAGVEPSNKQQGYVLRRLIRRAIFHLHLMGAGISGGTIVHALEPLKKSYSEIKENWEKINKLISEEGVRFGKSLNRGLDKLRREVDSGRLVDGKFAFDLYQTDGFPLELTLEILEDAKISFDEKKREEFKEEFEKHKELSRTASAGMFKGGLADAGEQTTKYHTATHLLHEALRQVLGSEAKQKGSNITSERLRFDFKHDKKLTDGEIKKVEKLINEQIGKDLPVSFEIMSLEEAKKLGAQANFSEKYGEKVKVYTIGSGKSVFSREVCGGPHVSSTGTIGHVRIIKEEGVSAGVRRIYAKSD